MRAHRGKPGGGGGPAPTAAGSPGKRTQIDAMHGGVRVHVHSTVAPPRPEALAGAGVAGPAGPLPHAAHLQQAFGAHDLGGVRAHQDPMAGHAAAGLGARAFAAGDDVAFAGAPDLHTAAHEAAHVIQHRAGAGGVHRKALDGGHDDAHERHADAVADAVVSGASAEPLLAAAPTAPPSVQRAGDAAAHSGATASNSGNGGYVEDIFMTEAPNLPGNQTQWFDHSDRFNAFAAAEAELERGADFDADAHAAADRIADNLAHPVQTDIDVNFNQHDDTSTTVTFTAADGTTMVFEIPALSTFTSYQGFVSAVTNLVTSFTGFRDRKDGAENQDRDPGAVDAPDPTSDPDPDPTKEGEEDQNVDAPAKDAPDEEHDPDTTPNPMADDPSGGPPMWMLTGGRMDRDGKANDERAIAHGRGGGVTDPGGEGGDRNGPMTAGEAQAAGAHIAVIGGGAVDGPERAAQAPASAADLAAVAAHMDGGAKDPAETSTAPARAGAAPIGRIGGGAVGPAGPGPKGPAASVAAARITSGSGR